MRYFWFSSVCLVAVFGLLLAAVSKDASAQSRSAWEALKRGQAVAIVRHAKAPKKPGAPRPKGPIMVNLWDCSTQRNLSLAGRAQAKRIGQAFRRRGISSARVISSAYCRTVETARLMGLGTVETNYDLNALSKPTAAQQTAGFRSLMRSAPAGAVTILVTHKTNIRALVGISPSSGETLIVSKSGKVLGRMKM